MDSWSTKRSKPRGRQVSDLHSHTGFWLRFVSNHVSHGFALKVGATGVTVAEWVILREMFDRDITSPGTLATATGLTRGAVSKLVERLREKKLLTRSEAVADRRFQNISLTSAGRTLVPELAALADANDKEFFLHLSRDEREQLMEILKKLVRTNKLGKMPVE